MPNGDWRKWCGRDRTKYSGRLSTSYSASSKTKQNKTPPRIHFNFTHYTRGGLQGTYRKPNTVN